MKRKSSNPTIESVEFLYGGNDREFNLFLKSVLRDYIAGKKESSNPAEEKRGFRKNGIC